MSKGPWRVRPTEVQRMIKTAQSAGLTIDRVELGRDGKLTIVSRESASSATTLENNALAVPTAPSDNKDEWEV
jgi:hypothetical protein